MIWGVISCHIQIHEYEVAGAADHTKEVEHFVRAERFVAGIEEGEFQSVDDAANGIDDAAG